MALSINGTDIPNTSTMTINATALDSVTMNGVLVWSKLTPPSQIADFAASSGDVDSITMTWSPAERAASYDLYEGSTKLATDVTSPYVYSVTGPYTGTFHVVAKNAAGTTASNEDEGFAESAIPDPPAKITDFTCTQNLTDEIHMDWTPANGATQHDLYQDGTKVVSDVTPPYVYVVEGPLTADFFIRASNEGGHTDSNTATGTSIERLKPPPPITDFTCTTDKVKQIVMYWSGDYTFRYDIYRGSTKIATGVSRPYTYYTSGAYSAVFHVRAHNDIGYTNSNSAFGAALAGVQPPAAITDFACSTDLTDAISMTWTPAIGATSYDIYEGSTKVATNVVSPYNYVVTGPHTGTFHVRAVNGEGFADSNTATGTALAALQVPPAITDFYVSTTFVNFIYMKWSDAQYASSYDVYDGNTRIGTNVTAPFRYDVVGPYTSEFYVKAINTVGSSESNHMVGTSVEAQSAPTAVTLTYTMNGSDINLTWTGGNGAQQFDLLKDGSVVQSGGTTFRSYTYKCTAQGIRIFQVTAKNNVGSTSSEAVAPECPKPIVLPGKITDLTASTDQINKVMLTWSPASNANRHDLYRNGVLLVTSVTSPFTDTFAIGDEVGEPTSMNYFIRAVNDDGHTDSNVATGIAQPAPASGNATIRYNSVSGGHHGTVSGSNGVFQFKPEKNTKNLAILIVGGGGSGASTGYVDPNYLDNHAEAGGGYAGGMYTLTLSDVPSSTVMEIVVGKGGASVRRGYTKGNAGEASRLTYGSTTYAASGGQSGTYYHPDLGGTVVYKGDGVDNDGNKNVIPQHTAWGGAGQTRTYGILVVESKGGNGADYSDAQAGTDGGGGGGVTNSYGGGEMSGAGGDGVIMLYWW